MKVCERRLGKIKNDKEKIAKEVVETGTIGGCREVSVWVNKKQRLREMAERPKGRPCPCLAHAGLRNHWKHTSGQYRWSHFNDIITKYLVLRALLEMRVCVHTHTHIHSFFFLKPPSRYLTSFSLFHNHIHTHILTQTPTQ